MIFSIGQRITARGENFIITNITTNKDETYILESLGISELVRGKSFNFDTAIDREIKPVDPTKTRLVADTQSGYRQTKLFIDTLIRNSFTSSDKITITCKRSYFADAVYPTKRGHAN